MTAADLPVSTHGNESKYRRDNVYWDEDAQLVLGLHSTLYRIQRGLWTSNANLTSVPPAHCGINSKDVACYTISEDHGVDTDDLSLLLDYLHGSVKFSSTDNDLSVRLRSLLRLTSASVFDLKEAYTRLQSQAQDVFPGGPRPYQIYGDINDAIDLAFRFNLAKVQKSVLYALVATDIPLDVSAEPVESNNVEAKVGAFMQSTIDFFSPMLFTVGTAGHIHCTDVFADQWMPLVIQPAIDDGGVYMPLETLQRIIDIEWATFGLCEDCTIAMRSEWTGQQNQIWLKMDDWI